MRYLEGSSDDQMCWLVAKKRLAILLIQISPQEERDKTSVENLLIKPKQIFRP